MILDNCIKDRLPHRYWILYFTLLTKHLLTPEPKLLSIIADPKLHATLKISPWALRAFL